MTESRNVQRTTVHDSRRTDPLLTSELETIYFKIDCRYPEEIAMMCEISYDKGNQKDLNFKRKYLLPVSYLSVGLRGNSFRPNIAQKCSNLKKKPKIRKVPLRILPTTMN